ncbi:MAG: chloride channel protein [Lachnoclostridium sp.]|nr:chloride channel protein [Lachnoclostridium sp.]
MNAKFSISTQAGRFGLWCQRHFPSRVFMFAISILTGFVTGFAAFLLKWLIGTVSGFVTSHFTMSGANYFLLGLPLVGFTLTMLFMRYVLHHNISHGIDKVIKQLRKKDYYIRPSLMGSPLIASTMTLGFGGSAGAEGPIATVGAAVGGNLGRWMKLDSHRLMIMIGCGAGAGIAAIFKAPVGGMLFTLEVLRLPLTTFNVITLLVTSIVAALTCYSFTGFTFDVNFIETTSLEPHIYIWVVALGLFCAFYSLWYSFIMKKMGHWLGGMHSPWIRSIAAAIVLGLLLFLFPALYGEGYGIMTKMVNGDFMSILDGGIWHETVPGPLLILGVTAGVMMVKAFATASTTWGGVAGDFAPTFFAGCMAGYVFAAGCNLLFHTDLPVADFALVGMAAVMAGVIRAPLMAIFLTAEMTGNFHLFMPIVLASAVSFFITAAITRRDFYERHFLDAKNIQK